MACLVHIRKHRKTGEVKAYDVRGVIDGRQTMPKGWNRMSDEVTDMMSFRDTIDWLEEHSHIWYGEEILRVPEEAIKQAISGGTVDVDSLHNRIVRIRGTYRPTTKEDGLHVSTGTGR